MKSIHPRTIGTSGLVVNPIGFGTWPLSKDGRPSASQGIRVILAAIDAGANFIDTADAYCLEQSEVGYCERLIAQALKERPQASIVIATKGGSIRPKGDWARNGTPKHLKQACETSLKALGVDCIDLYQLHGPDPLVPFGESIEALSDLKSSGKIRHVGLCNVSIEQLKEAQKIVEIVSVQNDYSPHLVTEFQNGMITYCEKNNLSFMPYKPLGGPDEAGLTAKHPLLLKIGKKYTVTPFQIALAWLLAQSRVMLPIPGTTTVEHVKSNMEAMQLILNSEDIAQLNKTFLELDQGDFDQKRRSN